MEMHCGSYFGNIFSRAANGVIDGKAMPRGQTVHPVNGYRFSSLRLDRRTWHQAFKAPDDRLRGINFAPTRLFSIWTDSATPGTPSEADPSSVELGVRLQSSVPGSILSIRFYKGFGNSGPHIGNLWTTADTNLASVSFTTETDSGWQQALFASPVAIAANTPYIASYFVPSGGYAADVNHFATTGVSNPPLQALVDGAVADGLYLYSSASGFPVNSYQSIDYWADILFSPGATYGISGTIAGGPGAPVALTGSSTATVTADGSGNYSFSGLANGSYTVTPSQTGTVFTPGSQNVTVTGANVTGINFNASPGSEILNFLNHQRGRRSHRDFKRGCLRQPDSRWLWRIYLLQSTEWLVHSHPERHRTGVHSGEPIGNRDQCQHGRRQLRR
jgi:hypothetical protein